MEYGERKTAKLAVAILAILLLSSMAMLLNSSNTATAQDYGDLLQYDWPNHCNDHNTNYNPGPGPTTPNIQWTTRRPDTGSSISGSPPIAMAGMIICYGGSGSSRSLYAFDALTGDFKWQTLMQGSFRGFSTGCVYQIDDTYLGYESSNGQVVYRISDGEFIAKNEITDDDPITTLGGFPCMYWGGFYDSENKMKHSVARDRATDAPVAVGFDLSNPTEGATIAWYTKLPTGLESLGNGGGLAFFGAYGEGEIYALNSTTGEIVWTQYKVGNAGYAAHYQDGRLYHSASSTTITCYDAATGEVIFDTDAGPRAFFAFGGALGHGMYYDKCMLPGAGYIGAWDALTGEPRWKAPGFFYISYDTVVVSGNGIVYGRNSDRSPGSGIAGYESEIQSFVALDAFTGELIWELPRVSANLPMLAYGNLYFVNGGTLYCIGDESPDWPGFASRETHGIAEGLYGPRDLSTPAWTFKADGPIGGSPVVADGKVYFGTIEGTYFCVDVDTHQEIWRFPTNYRVTSTPYVAGGRLYTGADDGKVYCLNAGTGELIWDVNAGIAGGAHVTPAFQVRSSPQVVGTTLYVGGMDGDLYALNTQNGQVRWKVHLADEGIAGSPTVVDGFVYIGDLYGNVSKLDAASGAILWQHWSDTSARRQCGTPVIAGDLCIIGRRQNGMRALNITDGSEVFTASLTLNTGSTPQMSTIAYRPSATVVVQNETNIGPGTSSATQYIVNSTTTDTFEMLYTSEGMHISAWALIREGTDIGGRYDPFVVNSTYAVRVWRGWVGHQCFSSTIVAASVDYRGDVLYVGDDAYGFTAFNATDGSYIYRYTTQGQVFSTPAIYDGAAYVTGQDGHLYVFKDRPSVEMQITTWNNKGEQMYAGETLEIHGRLVGVCDFTPEYPIHDPETFYPPIPGATVKVSFTNPDQTTVDYTAVTDKDGFFVVEHVPTDAGSCGWVVWYDGELRPSSTYYEAAYSEWYAITVTSTASNGGNGNGNGNGTEPPPAAALPMEYVYAAIAVIVIVVVAFLAYFLLKKK